MCLWKDTKPETPVEKTVEDSESDHIYSPHAGHQGVADSGHGGFGKVLGLSHVVHPYI